MAFETSETPSSGDPVRSGSGGSAPTRRKRGVSRFGYLMASGGQNTDPTSRQGLRPPADAITPPAGPPTFPDPPVTSGRGDGSTERPPPPEGPRTRKEPRIRPPRASVSQLRGETGTGEDSWASYGTVPSILGALLRKRKKVLGGSNLQDAGTLGGTTMRSTGDV